MLACQLACRLVSTSVSKSHVEQCQLLCQNRGAHLANSREWGTVQHRRLAAVAAEAVASEHCLCLRQLPGLQMPHGVAHNTFSDGDSSRTERWTTCRSYMQDHSVASLSCMFMTISVTVWCFLLAAGSMMQADR